MGMTGTPAALAPARAALRSQPASAKAGAPERLRTSRDVRAVFGARCRVGSEFAVVHARRRDDDGAPRVTTVAGKGVGNAVVRNRIKRRLRGALADCGLPAGADFVVVGRAAALSAEAAILRRSLRRQADAALARCP